jgi:hypothetical protein
LGVASTTIRTAFDFCSGECLLVPDMSSILTERSLYESQGDSPPPHPTCCGEGVGPAVTDAVRSVIVPRPLWSALPRSWFADPGCAGTGFWPGDAFPPWFVHVYVADPCTVRVAIAGTLPSPLKLPPVSVTDAPLKVAVGSDFTLTAASAVEGMAATASSAATISNRNFLIKVPFG